MSVAEGAPLEAAKLAITRGSGWRYLQLAAMYKRDGDRDCAAKALKMRRRLSVGWRRRRYAERLA